MQRNPRGAQQKVVALDIFAKNMDGKAFWRGWSVSNEDIFGELGMVLKSKYGKIDESHHVIISKS